MYFKNIIGQEDVARRLRMEAGEGRVAHGLLLSGPSGSGVLPLALAYGRYLCCQHPTADDACGQCPSCRQWEHWVHPDTHFVFPIVRSTKPRRETCDDYLPLWRGLLTENPYASLERWTAMMDAGSGQPLIYARESDELTRKLSLKAMTGGRRVVVMWLPERLHEAAANKLLKLLEEPPAGTVFLLASHAPGQVLPTIVSRMQRVEVPRIADEDLSRALVERLGVDAAQAGGLARRAGGDFGRALELLATDGAEASLLGLFTSLMRLAWTRRVREMKQWSEQMASLGREGQKAFLAYAGRMVRESFVANLHQPALNYLSPAEEAFTVRFAPFVSERNVQGLMDELALAQTHIEQNVNARMVFFDLILKMTVLIKNS